MSAVLDMLDRAVVVNSRVLEEALVLQKLLKLVWVSL